MTLGQDANQSRSHLNAWLGLKDLFKNASLEWLLAIVPFLTKINKEKGQFFFTVKLQLINVQVMRKSNQANSTVVTYQKASPMDVNPLMSLQHGSYLPQSKWFQKMRLKSQCLLWPSLKGHTRSLPPYHISFTGQFDIGSNSSGGESGTGAPWGTILEANYHPD